MVKYPPANEGGAGDVGSIPGLGRAPGVGNGNPRHYSCLGNPTNREAWWTIVHGVTKSWTQMCDEHAQMFLVVTLVENPPLVEKENPTTTGGESLVENPMDTFLENPMDRGAWQATVHGIIRVRHNLALACFLSFWWRKRGGTTSI